MLCGFMCLDSPAVRCVAGSDLKFWCAPAQGLEGEQR